MSTDQLRMRAKPVGRSIPPLVGNSGIAALLGVNRGRETSTDNLQRSVDNMMHVGLGCHQSGVATSRGVQR
jgi:hypothetical protein